MSNIKQFIGIFLMIIGLTALVEAIIFLSIGGNFITFLGERIGTFLHFLIMPVTILTGFSSYIPFGSAYMTAAFIEGLVGFIYAIIGYSLATKEKFI